MCDERKEKIRNSLHVEVTYPRNIMSGPLRNNAIV